MSIKNTLLSYFQNYDKPDEIEFGEFINYAGIPTTFKRVEVVSVSDILTDLNKLTFEIGVREVYVIKYGTLVYFLFGDEGTYGFKGAEIVASNIAFIVDSGDAKLLDDLTASITVGGISAGDTFPKGTLLEDVLIALLVKDSIKNLTYSTSTGSDAKVIEVGIVITTDVFSWNVIGAPTDMLLSDSVGKIVNEPVTGESHAIAKTYLPVSFGTVTWTLSSSSNSITRVTTWVFKTYFGKSANPEPPEDITAGNVLILDTSKDLSIPINTTDDEYGWIAIHKDQSKVFTSYFVSVSSKGPIVNYPSSNALYRHSEVEFDGLTYIVFAFSYSTAISNIKLL